MKFKFVCLFLCRSFRFKPILTKFFQHIAPVLEIIIDYILGRLGSFFLFYAYFSKTTIEFNKLLKLLQQNGKTLGKNLFKTRFFFLNCKLISFLRS